MPRQSTTIEQELARLREGAAGSEEYLERKQALFEVQVARLAQLLAPEVKKNLDNEASSTIADEWLSEATHALKVALPELPQGFEGDSEFKKAADRVRAEMTQDLLRAAIRPSADEIESHTDELAQCLLSNWLSILEHTKQLAGEAVDLNANALPVGIDQKKVYEGADAFAASIDVIASKFKEFQDALLQDGPIVELAPELYLVKGTEKLYLAGTRAKAEQLARKPAAPKGAKGKRVSLPYVIIHNLVEPFACTSPTFFGRVAKTASRDVVIDFEMEDQMARAAALQAKTAAGSKTEPDVVIMDIKLDNVLDKVSSNLVKYTILDLDQALGSDAFARFLPRIRQLGVDQSLINEAEHIGFETVDSMRRISLKATAYAISGAIDYVDVDVIKIEEVKQFVESNPEAGKVFSVSVNTARKAMASPGVKEMSVRLRGVISKAIP